MAQAISWTLQVQVEGGPNLSAASSTDVDAYDRIDIVIPGGDSGTPGTATVDVQPGTAAQVKFLLISSDKYGEELTYSIASGASNVKLDSQQLLTGAGAVGLLGADPNALEFSNGMGEGNDASITILVGRNVT